MGLSEVLALARTPEEREQMKQSFIRSAFMREEDIDLSDIPEKTDFSHCRPAKPYIDAMIARNRKREEERKQQQQQQQLQEQQQ